MDVAIASFSAMPREFAGEDLAIVNALRERGLQAEVVPRDAPGVDWSAYATVVTRTPWDYARRLEEFVPGRSRR